MGWGGSRSLFFQYVRRCLVVDEIKIDLSRVAPVINYALESTARFTFYMESRFYDEKERKKR